MDESLQLSQEYERLLRQGRDLVVLIERTSRKASVQSAAVRRFVDASVELLRDSLGDDAAIAMSARALAEDPDARGPNRAIRELVDLLDRGYGEHRRRWTFDCPAELLQNLGDDCIELAEALVSCGCHREAGHRAGRMLYRAVFRMGEAYGLSAETPVDQIAAAFLERRIINEGTHRRLLACLRIAGDITGPEAMRIPVEEIEEMVVWVRDFCVKNAVAL